MHGTGWLWLLLALSSPAGARAVPRAGGRAAAVRRYCDALQALPERRRASCCGTAPGMVLLEPCVKAVSAALAHRAAILATNELDGCVLAVEQAHAGCGWVGPWPPPLPEACGRVLAGQRRAGEACRSSLECAGALFCAHAGGKPEGRCSPPAAAGAACGGTQDALASYTRIEPDRQHPECAGSCGDRHCAASAGAGASCTATAQCGAGLRCGDGQCLAGTLGAAGEPCSGGDCAAGGRCLAGRCARPRPAGERCQRDQECLGGCVAGRCAMRCDVR